ncbi:MAG: MFS transporter [Thermoplasmata archaeon]|nr:MFS transporter [Thermoplasmata archaeon]
MGVRGWLPLIGLSLSVFIFNMSEFMPIGLLTGISADFGVSESRVGLIISVYAWAVAILSLPVMLLLKKMEYRRMLLMCVLVFVVFQFLSGVSTGYYMLMAARIGVAVSHAVFWSIATPLAVSVVDPRYHNLAIGAIATGTSIAMIVGLPMGRVIGLALGWRMTFITMAVAAFAIFILLALVFPRRENPGTFTVKRLPEIFRNRIVVSIYAIIAISVTGYYTAYSYIEPFLQQVAGMSDMMITVSLAIFGVAGIVSSIIFSRIYAKTRFPYIFSCIFMSAAVLLVFRASAEMMFTAVLACAVWGLVVTAFNVCLQNEIMAYSVSDAVPVTMSLFSGIYNAGIASGSIVGGIVTDTVGVGDIGYVGGLFILVGSIIAGLVLIPLIKKRDRNRMASA